MATSLKAKIEEYWSKIEDLTLDLIKSIKGDKNQCHVLSKNRFKDYFVRSTNLRVAAMLEQFLIEDQLFHSDASELVEQVTEGGDGPIRTNYNRTNINNESENFLNFVQEIDDTSHSSNNKRFVDDEQPTLDEFKKNLHLNVSANKKSVMKTHSNRPSSTEPSKLHCQTDPRTPSAHNHHDGSGCKMLAAKSRRGPTGKRKRNGAHAENIQNALKKYRMNLEATKIYDGEFDGSSIESSPPSSYKSRSLRYEPYRQQEWPLYAPHLRNYVSRRPYANQRAPYKKYIF